MSKDTNWFADSVDLKGEFDKVLKTKNNSINSDCIESPIISNLDKEVQKLNYVCCMVGSTSSNYTNSFLRLAGTTLWCCILIIHFSFGAYEAFKIYGYTFLCAHSLLFCAFLIFTLSTKYRTLPWLIKGLKELNIDGQYKKSITKMLKILKTCPYILVSFGLASSVVQHICLYVDDVTNIQFGLQLDTKYAMTVNIFRFLCSVYLYTAYGLFWVIPTCVILMTGYAMTEFTDQMGEKMRDKECVLTFKEAISTYSERAKFVKSSSSSSFILLTALILTGVCCFGLNVYIFLFSKRHYLLIWQSLLPLIVMIYPLCSAAWVTTQHNWFIIVVVRAWVHREDLDESSDDENSDNMHQNNQTKKFLQSTNGGISSKRNMTVYHPRKLASSNAIRNDILAAKNNENSKNNNPAFMKAVGTARAAAKFRMSIKKPRLNFEKFLSYLESMQTVVGFEIAGIVVTWDIVSTSLFLVFSIVAVFLQESIFGSQKSTL